jgi:hypothetical protein
MTDNDSFINEDVRRRAGGLNLDYQGVDADGVTQMSWGLKVNGDLPIDPWALRSAVEKLAWPDGYPEGHGEPEIYQIESRSIGQQVAQYVVESLPDLLVDAVILKALEQVAKKLKKWARPAWIHGSSTPETPHDWLAYATREAIGIACNTYRDLDGFVVISQSVSEPSVPGDTSAMIGLQAPDGTTVVVHIWLVEGSQCHSTTRVPPRT